MAVLSAMQSTGRLSWAPLLLLLLFILTQMVISLVVFAGVFIQSNKALISPFHLCLMGQDCSLSCEEQYNHNKSNASIAAAETNMNVLRVVVILGLYAPLVLVAFALLAMLLAIYGEDRGALWVSVVCQASSSLLTIIGIAVFVGLHWPYVSPADMTVWYYVYVNVYAELAITALLTCRLGRWLAAGWE